MRTLLVLLVASAAAEELLTVPIPGHETTYQLVQKGKGRTVDKGSKVTVHATGVVEESGYKFWSTKDPGQQAFKYNAGVGSVITGWDQGCLGSACCAFPTCTALL